MLFVRALLMMSRRKSVRQLASLRYATTGHDHSEAFLSVSSTTLVASSASLDVVPGHEIAASLQQQQ